MEDDDDDSSIDSESDEAVAMAFSQVCVQMGGKAQVDEEEGSDEESDDAETGAKSTKRKKQAKNPHGPDWKHYAEWGEIGQGGPRQREAFNASAGVFPPPLLAGSSLDYFRLTFTDEMRRRIVTSTNSQVAQIKASPRKEGLPAKRSWPPKWCAKWRDINLDELDVFLALLMLKGGTHHGNEKSFWSTNTLLRRPAIGMLMSRNRFMDIKRALHCQDDVEPPDPSGPLPKVGILMEMFLSRAREIYIPGENCSIDEMMLKFTGTSKYKFTKQAKPTSDGLKIFAVCESVTGYVIHGELDLRDKDTIENTVLRLTKHVSGHYRCVYMDNLFVSVSTLRQMLELKTYGAGTTRAGRGLPDDLEKKSGKVKKVGEVYFAQAEDGFLAAQWMDMGVCVGLSTKHDGLPATVLRRSPGMSVRVERPSLDIFADYNKYMGGVDLADLRRAWHTCRLRSFKWWHAVFFWILDSAMINAHIFRNRHIGRVMPGSKFWLEVIEALVEKRLTSRGDGSVEDVPQYVAVPIPDEAKVLGSARLCGKHYAVAAELRARCKLCMHTHPSGSARYDNKTKLCCGECNLHLHLECFKSFHEDENPVSAFT